MKQEWKISVVAKHFLNSVIDACILPGTANGTAILWLYSKQWIRDVSIIAVTIVTLLSNISPSGDAQNIIHHTIVDPDRSPNQFM